MIVLAAAAALAAAEPAPEDPAATLRAVQAMYDQSCQVRAYGSYDDLCDSLKKQLREAAQAQRKAPPARRPAAVSTPTLAEAPAAPAAGTPVPPP
ncbi:MAG TPA: hypothetical protein VL358_15215 [Caulobacteraceae bacterium]|jgi:hypothetical protein|nr:hypothetical protein [Caulobacteraceae bacterium]